MDITVHFCGPTVKQVRRAWQYAVQRGQGRLIRHITALVGGRDGGTVVQAAVQVGVRRAWGASWSMSVPGTLKLLAAASNDKVK